MNSLGIRGLGLSLALAAGAVQAGAIDTYNGTTLTIPTLAIANATYSNVQVGIAGILGGPAGTAAVDGVDSYDPLTGKLKIQAVSVGSGTFYNVQATVRNVVSIGSVSGADVYNGTTLTIPYVQVGATIYRNAVVKVGTIVRVAGGMPTLPWDSYDAGTKQLSVPAVQFGNKVYTNAVVTVASIVSVGGGSGTAQTIRITSPTDTVTPLGLGTSEPITATATSGLPVSYYVSTPSICSVVHSTAQEQYFYFSYAFTVLGKANLPVAGSVILGGVPVGANAWQANTADGTATMINGQAVNLPLGLFATTTIYPNTGPYYTGPYTNYAEPTGVYFWDNVFSTAGPILDAAGLNLQAPGDYAINLGYSGGYYYIDAIQHSLTGHGSNLTTEFGSLLDGIVALSGGSCVITAFQNGNSTYQSATPVTITLNSVVIVLP